jgi:hypothetical protein
MVTSRVQSIKPPGEGTEAAPKWITARLGELAFISESHDRHGDCREDFRTLAGIANIHSISDGFGWSH